MANKETSKTPFDPEIKKGLVIALVIVLLFGSGNFLGGLFSKKTGINPVDSTSKAAVSTTAATTQAPTQATTQAPAPQEQTTAAQSNAPADQTTAASNAEQTTAAPAPSTGAPTTKAEIVQLFNESANKIKTNATKVTRNYEDLQHNADKTVLPSALQGIGSPLISTFLKKNETPVEYTGADIVAQYPVAGENFVSKTTEADLSEATCTDDGTNYNIVLKFNDCTDPVGSGCANAFTLIKESDVKENAKVVQTFSISYSNAKIECKIDKATGNMVWANYTLPMVLSVTAKVLVSIDAQVGMTFVHDYSIEY